MLNYIVFRLQRLKQFENKLRRYNAYRPDSIIKWKGQMNLSWNTTRKVLTELRVFTSREIRQMLKQTVEQNKQIFDGANCYICRFGRPGKSGEIILYEFCHGCPDYGDRVVEMWKLPALPENSTIVFIDDLLGTGRQSTDYISTNVAPFLNRSHNPLLMSLCATPQGIQKVSGNTNFRVIPHLILDDPDFQHYSDESRIFDHKERTAIKEINNMLHGGGMDVFDRGLLIAFYYSVPNNTMPLIWKDNYEYSDRKGNRRTWFALLPRHYVA